ncbi:MAG: LysM peptidoglycan-binding domain-containing protein [bacterium]
MNKFSRLLISATASFLLAATALADQDLVKSNHPDVYVVKKGDTLWDISGRFLNKPWRWPEIWHVNPQVENPHLIYPGDRLELVFIDGKPVLRKQGSGIVKLSPEIRATPWDGAIPPIPYDAIAPFLSRPYVMSEGELESAPYVLRVAGEHIAGGEGNKIYVRTIESDAHKRFDIVRPGDPYTDYETGEVLGHEARFLGVGELTRTGDPATLRITSSKLEVLEADRLVEAKKERPVGDFYPKVPEGDVKGAIIDVLNGVGVIGPLDVVVIDRGAADGMSPGVVLQINRRGETVEDRVVERKRGKEMIKLPDEKAGHLMVFRAFDRVSFALVMNATVSLRVGDIVTNP